MFHTTPMTVGTQLHKLTFCKLGRQEIDYQHRHTHCQALSYVLSWFLIVIFNKGKIKKSILYRNGYFWGWDTEMLDTPLASYIARG